MAEINFQFSSSILVLKHVLVVGQTIRLQIALSVLSPAKLVQSLKPIVRRVLMGTLWNLKELVNEKFTGLSPFLSLARFSSLSF